MKTNNRREQYELDNALYLIDDKKPFRLVANCELFKKAGIMSVSTETPMVDYIDCESGPEAKHLRGLLWNAFAAGRTFAKAQSLEEVR